MLASILGDKLLGATPAPVTLLLLVFEVLLEMIFTPGPNADEVAAPAPAVALLLLLLVLLLLLLLLLGFEFEGVETEGGGGEGRDTKLDAGC